MLGITHKDIEKIMKDVLKERQLSEREQEAMELEQLAPEKFDLDLELEFKINNHAADNKKSNRFRFLSREEVLMLFKMSTHQKTNNNNSLNNQEYNVYSRNDIYIFIKEFISRSK